MRKFGGHRDLKEIPGGFGIRPASGNRRGFVEEEKNNVCFCVNRFRRADSLPPPDVGAVPASGMTEEIARIRRTSVNLWLGKSFGINSANRRSRRLMVNAKPPTGNSDVYICVSGSLENTIFTPGFS